MVHGIRGEYGGCSDTGAGKGGGNGANSGTINQTLKGTPSDPP